MEKVAHISTVHHPLDTRIFYKECKTLVESGYNVFFIVTEHEDIIDLNKLFNINFVKLKKYKNRFKRMIFSSINAYRAASKLNASIYHIHDPELLLIGVLLQLKGKKVIYDIHEDYKTSISQKKYIFKSLRGILSFLFGSAESVLSKNMEKIIAEKYYKARFPNSTDILNYPIVQNNIDSSYSSVSKKFIYTGNVTKDRGAIIQSKIPNYFEGINVNFVGYCKSYLAQEMFKNSTDINILGIEKYIPREQIDEEYRNHEWLGGLAIFPPTQHYKKKELTKFFEYMNAGLPIIASDFSKWKEFLEKYNCGIVVNPYDENDIKEKINYLIDNPNIAKTMGENGKKAIKTQLNWNIEGEKLLKVYKHLLYNDLKEKNVGK